MVNWVRFTSKEQKIAVKLAGRIKNFTGRSPAIIKVKIDEPMITIHFKWIVNDCEKSMLESQINQEFVNGMQSKLFEITSDNLHKVLPIVFENKFEIHKFDGDLFQENVVVQIQLLDLVS